MKPTSRRRFTRARIGARRTRIAIDLFSGSGGLTEGLKRAGFAVLAAVENDSLAAETYRRNHRAVSLREQDIRQIDPQQWMMELGLTKGGLDLLAGCPPCQGFSAMRTLNGHLSVDDEQNDLVFQFLRFVEALQPRAVMIENVPALATDPRMAILIKTLVDLGYTDGKCAILNAADHGVPQRRRRMIFVVIRGKVAQLAPKFPLRKTVADAIRHLKPPGQTGDALHDFPEKRTARIQEMISGIPKDGGSRMALGQAAQLECHRKCDGFKDVYGRMAWNRPSPTITGGCFNPSKGRFLHPEQDRAITLREAALLQSFPQRYFFSLRHGKSGAALLIGNALPPDLIKRQAYQVRRSL